MNSDRIKELQEQTAYPKSISVYKALLQVWNECQQEHNEQLRLHSVVDSCRCSRCGEKHHDCLNSKMCYVCDNVTQGN